MGNPRDRAPGAAGHPGGCSPARSSPPPRPPRSPACPSATSYHLKALERWGIVAAGQPRADGRDRPWKATGGSIEVSSDAPRTVLAETAVLGVFLDRNRALAAGFLGHQDEEPAQWRDTMELANSDYWLTSAELAEISAALRRVLEPYEQRRRNSRPDRSRRVWIAPLIVPRADSPAPKSAGARDADGS
jgi:hypothetical protein